MRKLVCAIIYVSVIGLCFGPCALADQLNGGQGWIGEADDKTVTYFGLGCVCLFPLIALVFSLIQATLDKRKAAKLEANQARAQRAKWHGGW